MSSIESIIIIIMLIFVALGSDSASCTLTLHHRKMNEVVTCGFFSLILDAVLSLSLWAGLVLLRWPSCGPLVGVWTFGAVKWVFLYVFTSMLTDGKPRAVLCRFVAVLCFLPPVFESGRFLMADSSEAYVGPGADLSTLLLGSVSSSLACVFWENLFCGDGKKRDADTVNSQQLLKRLLNYCRPDTLYLIAAFSFLILAVLCKCEVCISYGVLVYVIISCALLHFLSFFYVL